MVAGIAGELLLLDLSVEGWHHWLAGK